MREQLSGPSLHGRAESAGVAIFLQVSGCRPLHLLASASSSQSLISASPQGRNCHLFRPWSALVPGRHVLWLTPALPRLSPAWASLATDSSLGHVVAAAPLLSSLRSSHPPNSPQVSNQSPSNGPVVCAFALPLLPVSSGIVNVSLWGILLRSVSSSSSSSLSLSPRDDALHLRVWSHRGLGSDEVVRSASSRDLQWRSPVRAVLAAVLLPVSLELSLWSDRGELARGELLLLSDSAKSQSYQIQLLDSRSNLLYEGSLSAQWTLDHSKFTGDPVLSVFGRAAATHNVPPPVPSRIGR